MLHVRLHHHHLLFTKLVTNHHHHHQTPRKPDISSDFFAISHRISSPRSPIRCLLDCSFRFQLLSLAPISLRTTTDLQLRPDQVPLSCATPSHSFYLAACLCAFFSENQIWDLILSAAAIADVWRLRGEASIASGAFTKFSLRAQQLPRARAAAAERRKMWESSAAVPGSGPIRSLPEITANGRSRDKGQRAAPALECTCRRKQGSDLI